MPYLRCLCAGQGGAKVPMEMPTLPELVRGIWAVVGHLGMTDRASRAIIARPKAGRGRLKDRPKLTSTLN
jgi:hypothetical protein